MARALEAILQELDSVYNPQKDVYNQQINALPGQQQAELGGLDAAKNDSFQQIVQGANRRGVAFGGIPLEEQARYLGSTYMPAVANLKGRFQGQKSDLQLRLAELAAQQRKDAYDIYNSEVANDNARAAASAASSGGFSPSLGKSGGSVLGTQASYGYSKKADGGFAFVDPNGNPISAATYAQATGMQFRDLLQYMANQGDKGAQTALNFVGNFPTNGGTLYDPTKIANYAGLYNSLVWGSPYGYVGTSNTGYTGGSGGGVGQSSGGLQVIGGGSSIPTGTYSGQLIQNKL